MVYSVAELLRDTVKAWFGAGMVTPRSCIAKEDIVFALVTVYRLKKFSVGRVAGRAEAMRAIAPSIAPHACTGRSAEGQRRDFLPQAKSFTSRLWRFTA
jgi:hypothetical protein